MSISGAVNINIFYLLLSGVVSSIGINYFMGYRLSISLSVINANGCRCRLSMRPDVTETRLSEKLPRIIFLSPFFKNKNLTRAICRINDDVIIYATVPLQEKSSSRQYLHSLFSPSCQTKMTYVSLYLVNFLIRCSILEQPFYTYDCFSLWRLRTSPFGAYSGTCPSIWPSGRGHGGACTRRWRRCWTFTELRRSSNPERYYSTFIFTQIFWCHFPSPGSYHEKFLFPFSFEEH